MDTETLDAHRRLIEARRAAGLDDDGNDPDSPVPLGREQLVDWAARAAAHADAAGIDHEIYQPPPSAMTVDVADLRDDRQDVWRRIVPQRFWDATIDDLTGQERDLADEWTADPTRNVLLVGDLGAGKTHVLFACARWRFDQGATLQFWPTAELLQAMRPDSTVDGDVLADAIAADVLILDDLGVEKPSEWTAEQLYILVNRRWLERRPTLASSNLPHRPDPARPEVPTFEEGVGSRLYSRLHHGALRLVVAGDDRRRDGR